MASFGMRYSDPQELSFEETWKHSLVNLRFFGINSGKISIIQTRRLHFNLQDHLGVSDPRKLAFNLLSLFKFWLLQVRSVGL